MYPADIVPNVQRMAPVVDDIELVLFQSEHSSNFPHKKTIAQLKELGKDNGCTYTVHFPIDKKAGSSDPGIRRSFVNAVKTLVDLTSDLTPFAYILHLEGISGLSTPEQIETWRKNVNDVCSEICAISLVEKSKICIENLDYNIDLNADVASLHGFSLCLDIGHLFLYHNNWPLVCRNFAPRAKVIHVHGIRDGKDHNALRLKELNKTHKVLREVLETFFGVLTLEVFNEQDFLESREAIEGLWLL